QRIDDGPDNDGPEPGGPVYLSEHSESNGTDDQPGPYQRPWAHPAREYWDHYGAHDERGHRGHRRQPCLEWRKTQHELQVLRDEDVRSKRNERSEERRVGKGTEEGR